MITLLQALERHYAHSGQNRDDSANSGREGANMESIKIFHEILADLVCTVDKDTARILRNRYFELITRTKYQTDVVVYLPFVVSTIVTGYDQNERNKISGSILR